MTIPLHPCRICGLMPDDCTCPECPVCGEIGSPECEAKHGLRRDEHAASYQ